MSESKQSVRITVYLGSSVLADRMAVPLGVWDTVGSLGIPYDPLQWGRTRVEVGLGIYSIVESMFLCDVSS